MAAADDAQAGIHLLDVGDGGGIFRLVGAEHIERQLRRQRFSGDDVKQIGGGDAFRQWRLRLQPRHGDQRLPVGIDEIGGAEQPSGHRLGRTARQHLAIG